MRPGGRSNAHRRGAALQGHGGDGVRRAAGRDQPCNRGSRGRTRAAFSRRRNARGFRPADVAPDARPGARTPPRSRGASAARTQLWMGAVGVGAGRDIPLGYRAAMRACAESPRRHTLRIFGPMKILLVATKPPWPLIDGGRLLLWHTIAGLARHGAEITLVAPVDAGSNCEAVDHELRALCRPVLVTPSRRIRLESFARALVGGAPVSIALHRFAAMRERVQELIAAEAFDLIHAEQVQAVANCEGAGFSDAPVSTLVPAIPLVLRSQNVESDLWRQLAEYRPALRPLLLREARRLGVWEAQAVRRANITVALTRGDAAQLAALANESGDVHHVGKVHHVPAPFPAELAPGRAPVLAGVPPVVLFAGTGWLPNREGVHWFIRDVWPVVCERLPDAVLHIFGSVSVRGR